MNAGFSQILKGQYNKIRVFNGVPPNSANNASPDIINTHQADETKRVALRGIQSMRIANTPRVLLYGTALLSRRTSLVPTSSWLLSTLLFPPFSVRGLLTTSSSFCPDSGAPSGMKKTAQELQSQWAGGIDVWRAVPVANDQTILICNRVQRSDYEEPTTASSEWPAIVQRSVLFGFGAYNPRGQTLPDDINEKQHASLQADIEEGLKKYTAAATYWEAASLWEDGSSEKGFIIAVDASSPDLRQAQRWVVELATKYNQGAIYKFHYDNQQQQQQRLIRETVAVLDPGTDATVSVIRDDSIPIPSNLWDRDNK